MTQAVANCLCQNSKKHRHKKSRRKKANRASTRGLVAKKARRHGLVNSTRQCIADGQEPVCQFSEQQVQCILSSHTSAAFHAYKKRSRSLPQEIAIPCLRDRSAMPVHTVCVELPVCTKAVPPGSIQHFVRNTIFGVKCLTPGRLANHESVRHYYLMNCAKSRALVTYFDFYTFPES